MTQQTDEQPIEEPLDVDNLYDSERRRINEVFAALSDNIGAHRELGAFQREVRERFAEIGFVARCDIMQSEHEEHLPREERTNYPEITLVGRCEPTILGQFDHERMGHEVRSDLLHGGQNNVQKTQVAGGFSTTKSGLVVPD